MDFLDPAKKRLRRRRLFLAYILMALLIGTGSWLLINWAYGYTIDRRTGQIIQNGLLFIASSPEASDIYIDGVHKTGTDARLSLPSGQYAIELKRDGYNTWKHDLNLQGGTIERLTYPKLFPTELKPADTQLYASLPTVVSQSPDRRWLMVLRPGSVATFDIFDTNDIAKPSTAAAVPESLLASTAGKHELSVVEWADDNRHVLLLHKYTGGEEYILFDREKPEESTNLSSTFNTKDTKLTLKEKKYDFYYIHDQAAKSLVEAELKSGKTTLILDNVLAFKDHASDVVFYVSDAGSKDGSVTLRLKDGGNDYALRTMPAAVGYPLDIARYSGSWYAAAALLGEGNTYVFKDPADARRSDPDKTLVPVSVLRVDNVSKVAFSANTQYVMAESGSNFSVYDIENDRRFQYALKLPVEGSGKSVWMDGNRLTALSGGKAIVFDYDGTNLQTLVKADYLPFFDRDYLKLYTVGPSVTVPSRAAVVQTDLKINK